MKHRPWIIIILAVLHILAPIGNLMVNAAWRNMGVLDYAAQSLTLANFQKHWIHFLAPIVAGIAIYACKKWSFYLYIACMVLLFYSSYRGYQEVQHLISIGVLLSVFFINILVVTYFLIPAVRNIYFDPRLRWWETKPRYNIDTEVQFFNISAINPQTGAAGKIQTGRISNFSESGLFIKSDHPPQDHDVIEIRFKYQGTEYRLSGETVLHKRQHAIGFGLQFMHSASSEKQSASLAQLLESNGHLIPGRSAGPEDTFTFWARTLFKTGRGIIPTKR